ncbi:hypothetical protein K439DRAFT_864322 [Ramaria rubella]|nr:hypothetical protein K439DRAFT_864322 [Ramaria rubella]
MLMNSKLRLHLCARGRKIRCARKIGFLCIVTAIENYLVASEDSKSRLKLLRYKYASRVFNKLLYLATFHYTLRFNLEQGHISIHSAVTRLTRGDPNSRTYFNHRIHTR